MAAVPGVRSRANVALPFRIDRRMVVGIALVGVSLAGGLVLWRGATDTTMVVVAARDIPPGHVIQRDDLALSEASLSGALGSLALEETELEVAIGRTAGSAIHAGEMLVRPDLADGSALGADQVAVTIPVETDSVYAGLRPTDEVALLATVNAGEPDSTTTTLLDRAVVFDIALDRGIVRSTSADGTQAEGDVTNVTLAIPRSEAERVANALVNAELTVVLLPRASGSTTGP
ncbi:MAG: flagella basal body P-ring formation protein FlgA [Dehalococcoidia bacterium]|nr:flagella basal body P-ring formation protein FlgA [Dehalococcoidia bacterium]